MEGEHGPITANLYVYLSHPSARSTILVGILLETPPIGPRQGHTEVLYDGKTIEIRVKEYKSNDAVEFYFDIHDNDDYWTRITRQQSRIEPEVSGPHHVDRQIVGRQVAPGNDYMVTVMVHAGAGVQTFSLLPLSRTFRAGDGVTYRLQVLDQAPFLELRLG